MKKNQNTFIDILGLLLSFLQSIWRSIWLLFSKKRSTSPTKFFEVLDYVFRVRPESFWKKPSGFKIGIFLSGLIQHIFYKKK